MEVDLGFWELVLGFLLFNQGSASKLKTNE